MCHDKGGGQRTTLQGHFSGCSFTWVPQLSLGARLAQQMLYLERQLAGPHTVSVMTEHSNVCS